MVPVDAAATLMSSYIQFDPSPRPQALDMGRDEGRKAAAAQTAQLQQRLTAAEQRAQQQQQQLQQLHQQQQQHVRDAEQRAAEKAELEKHLHEARQKAAKVAALQRQLEEERQRAAAAEARMQAVQAELEALRAQQRQSQKEEGQRQQLPQAGLRQAAQPGVSPLPQAAMGQAHGCGGGTTPPEALQQQVAAACPAPQGKALHTVPGADKPAAMLGPAAVPPRSPLPARSPLASSSAPTATPPPQHLPQQHQRLLTPEATPVPGSQQQRQQNNHHHTPQQQRPVGTYTPLPATAPNSAAGTTPTPQHTPHQQQQPPQNWAAPPQQQPSIARAGSGEAPHPSPARPYTAAANPNVQQQRAATPLASAQRTATPPPAHTSTPATAGNAHHLLACTPPPPGHNAPHNTHTPTASTPVPGPSAFAAMVRPKLPQGPEETKEAVRAIISKHGSAGVSGPELVREVGGLCASTHPSRQQQEQLLREAVRDALQGLVEEMDVMRMGPGARSSQVQVGCPDTRFMPL